jgi:hypothetical protein
MQYFTFAKRIDTGFFSSAQMAQKGKILRGCDRKELARTKVRLQLILFFTITGAFLFRIFGGYLHVLTTQIYCLTGAIFSETRVTNIYLKLQCKNPPQVFFSLSATKFIRRIGRKLLPRVGNSGRF